MNPQSHAAGIMKFPAFWAGCAVLLPLWLETASAADSAWDEGLARKFSGRLKVVEQELAQLPPKLHGLPVIPVDDQGGTGGWASVHGGAEPAADKSHAVEIRWPQAAPVDWLALVPARRYDARGLDAQYGMPDAFTVELIDAAGNTVALVARERGTSAHPVRKGHPFVYEISPPVEAAGLRISADSLLPDFEDKSSFVHAWAEVFAYAGNQNLTRGAAVRAIGGSSPPAPWHWAAPFLIDGQTPLGLPEIPAEEHRNVGWLSEGRADANVSTSVTADLGEAIVVDAIRLLPAKRPTSDLPSGFGFPRKLVVSVSESGSSDDWRVAAERDYRNPGHNPVLVPIDAGRARYVKIEATQLWKAFESYPAFFALSEVEVLSGNENVSLGKIVRSADGMQNLIAPGGRFWTSAALSDGFGPDGRLVSPREWLSRLDDRLRIETRSHELRAEAAELIAGWRRAALTFFALMGLAGAFAIIAVPIRYRIHANRELLKVRERIAGDLHDEVGSNLGSIQMFADLAESRSGPSEELKRIQRIAAETVSAVRDIVWLLRPGGDHRIATVEHLRETGSIMLESLEWKFTANETAWGIELPEESNRDLFLFFREALHNILRHARATKVEIHAEAGPAVFRLRIADDGCGIPPEKLERTATLRALRQRTAALGGELKVDSSPDGGTRLELMVPLTRKHRRKVAPSPAS
jgi:signal transduction histidine kinase